MDRQPAIAVRDRKGHEGISYLAGRTRGPCMSRRPSAWISRRPACFWPACVLTTLSTAPSIRPLLRSATRSLLAHERGERRDFDRPIADLRQLVSHQPAE